MIDEKKIKIEPHQAFFQIGFKYGEKEGTVVINDEFDHGFDAYISDYKGKLSKEEEKEIISYAFKKFIKIYLSELKI